MTVTSQEKQTKERNEKNISVPQHFKTINADRVDEIKKRNTLFHLLFSSYFLSPCIIRAFSKKRSSRILRPSHFYVSVVEGRLDCASQCLTRPCAHIARK